MLSSHALHSADEVQVSEYSWPHRVGTNWLYTEWYISTNDLAKQPHWDGFSEAPLSTREACALALTKISAEFPNINSWAVVSVWLRNPLGDGSSSYPDGWCYEIRFMPRDPQLRKQFEDEACPEQIVLLDGTVVPGRKVECKDE